MGWNWDPRANRYRNEAGQFMARSEAMGYVNGSIANAGSVADSLAGLAGGGQISPNDWRLLMRQELKDETIRQYLIGVGGRQNMTQAHWGSVGGMLSEQFRYLDDFAAELEGKSAEYIAARSAMYLDATREAYWRAKARIQGIPEGSVPAWPGDGSTDCLTRCQCEWVGLDTPVRDENGSIIRWECYWTLNPVVVKHCDTCLSRAGIWNPLIIAP